MARNLNPITKLSRREGCALHPKAHKIMVKRTNLPGKSARAYYGAKSSQYAIQLREKQKVKRLYGLLEKQFSNIMKEAGKTSGKSGDVLLQLLEKRLDNVVYRSGFAVSRQAARQLVNHGHFLVDGQKVNIPSYRVRSGQTISVKDSSKKRSYFSNFDQVTETADVVPLSWLKPDTKKLEIKVTGDPKREEAEANINEQLIVEYYSR